MSGKRVVGVRENLISRTGYVKKKKKLTLSVL